MACDHALYRYRCTRCGLTDAQIQNGGSGNSLTSRILIFVEEHPNITAWGIAKNIQADTNTVSSILRLKTERGILRRTKGLTGSWVYSSSPPSNA